MSTLRPLFLTSLSLALLSACGGDDGGSILLSVATQGANPDPDGYVVTLGDRTTNAPTNGDVTITDLAAGSYTITLSGIAPGCAVAGTNPVFVRLDDGGQGRATFNVTCPTPATVNFTVTSTGPADADGYLIRISPEEPQRILANGLTSVQSLAPGRRSLILSDVAPDCTPSSTNPVMVDVRVDQPAEIALLVRCGGMGALHVTVNGNTLGADERFIVIEDEFYPLDSAGEVTLPALRSGPYPVYVYGCDIIPDNPQMVTVEPGVTTDVTFTVSVCSTGPL